MFGGNVSCDRRHHLTDLVQIQYLWSSCKYPVFFCLPLKIRVVHIKNVKCWFSQKKWLNPVAARCKLVWLAVISWKNAMHFTIQFFYFSCKTTPLLGNWKHPHKYNRKGQPRWFHGYHTRHWIRGSLVQTRPGPMDFFSEGENPEYDFLWKGSKAVGPVS